MYNSTKVVDVIRENYSKEVDFYYKIKDKII
jgi:hypothetical protein